MQVLTTLTELEVVGTFPEFVSCFSRFGNEMVELAHLTGDRQNVGTVKIKSKPQSVGTVKLKSKPQNVGTVKLV